MLLIASLVLCLMVAPLMVHAQVENLVLNPSFEEDEIILDDPSWQAWATWGWEKGLDSTVRIDESEFVDGARSLRIEPKGDINWHFIVLNQQMTISVGETYTASFWAKAEEERPIAARLKATDNSVDFCYTELGFITTEWSEFSFECDNPLNNVIKFEIYCAGSEVPFWLDFVNLYEGEYIEGIMPSEFEPKQPVEPAGKLPIRWAELKLSR